MGFLQSPTLRITCKIENCTSNLNYNVQAHMTADVILHYALMFRQRYTILSQRVTPCLSQIKQYVFLMRYIYSRNNVSASVPAYRIRSSATGITSLRDRAESRSVTGGDFYPRTRGGSSPTTTMTTTTAEKKKKKERAVIRAASDASV